ncbi:MAG: hypothetical protein KAW17_11350 [Candidatus Eisenbacteria sp.]|nr:hypothetical protein [Candidatus Eisenbacteria bacterium]
MSILPPPPSTCRVGYLGQWWPWDGKKGKRRRKKEKEIEEIMMRKRKKKSKRVLKKGSGNLE